MKHFGLQLYSIRDHFTTEEDTREAFLEMKKMGYSYAQTAGTYDYITAEKFARYAKEAGIEIKDHGWGLNFPNAFTGHDPVGCNERIGKAALRMQAEKLAHAFKVFKEDENVLKWHQEMQKGW